MSCFVHVFSPCTVVACFRHFYQANSQPLLTHLRMLLLQAAFLRLHGIMRRGRIARIVCVQIVRRFPRRKCPLCGDALKRLYLSPHPLTFCVSSPVEADVSAVETALDSFAILSGILLPLRQLLRFSLSVQSFLHFD